MQQNVTRGRRTPSLAEVLVGAFATILTVLALAGTAQAADKNICPSNQSGNPPASAWIGANSDRCVHTIRYSGITRVTGMPATTNGAGVEHCAVVKPNIDGSGGNVGGRVSCVFGLNNSDLTFAGTTPGTGYPVLVNRTAWGLGFRGHLWWG